MAPSNPADDEAERSDAEEWRHPTPPMTAPTTTMPA
jgi:hypothetical protein